MTTAETRRYTPDDLLAMEDAAVLELVDGQLVERNVSADSSRVAVRVSGRLADYVHSAGAGDVYDSELGVRCFADPDRVRRGDVLFVRSENVPRDDPGFLRVPPDLVVEVVSPNDSANEVRSKVSEWLEAGVLMVWVAYPRVRELHVYRAAGHPSIATADDEIDAEDVVPGFSCPVARFFPEPAATPPPAQP